MSTNGFYLDTPQAFPFFFFFFKVFLRGGCICRRLRLAPRRDAAPPPFSLHAHSFEPDLIRSPSNINNKRRTYRTRTSVQSTPTIQTPVASHDKAVASSAAASSSPPPSTSHTPNRNEAQASQTAAKSALHPRVAVILGVDRRWYVPLLVCRALSTAPAAWWGLRCAFTFLAELLHIRPGMGHEGWATAIIGSIGQDWDVERRFRVTEVALAIMWVC